MIENTSVYNEQSIFDRIMYLISTFLEDLDRADIWEDRHVRDCFSQNRYPDYDQYATPFAKAYFLENFLKAASIFLQDSSPYVRSIIDAGCGSGSAALAYLAVLEQSFSNDEVWHLNVIMVDRSKEQLELAKRLFELVQGEFKHLHITVQFFPPIDLLDWQPKENIADRLFFSHVLTENPSNIQILLEKALLALSSNSKIYVIERTKEKDPIWDSVEEVVSQLALPAKYGLNQVASDHIKLGNLWQFPQITNKPKLMPRYLVLSIPEQKQLVKLLKLYFQAWETQSTELLEDIFASHAIYYEKPFEPSLQGLEQIKEYWRENVLKQRNISVRVLLISYTDNVVWAEWEAKFSKSQLNMRLKGMLSLTLDPELGRITELREYYRSLKKWE